MGPAGGLPVGDPDHPERDIIVWMDHRALGQAARINAGGHDVLRYVGGRISPEMQTPKLLWLKENRPGVYAAAAHFLDLTDFLTWKASGATARSACTVTCKWTYLAHESRWDADYFRAIGLGDLADDGFARIGAEVVHPGTALGQGLTAEAAAAMGLRPGTAVARGWLLSIRPEMPWRAVADVPAAEEPDLARDALDAQIAAAGHAPEHAALLLNLGLFHGREQKPGQWAVFDAAAKEGEDLAGDLDALGLLSAAGPVEPEKRSFLRSYAFPPQETKLRSGSRVTVANPDGPPVSVQVTSLDRRAGRVTVKAGPGKAHLLSDRLGLGPDWPLNTDGIAAALAEVIADQCGPEAQDQPAVADFHRTAPKAGEPLLMAARRRWQRHAVGHQRGARGQAEIGDHRRDREFQIGRELEHPRIKAADDPGPGIAIAQELHVQSRPGQPQEPRSRRHRVAQAARSVEDIADDGAGPPRHLQPQLGRETGIAHLLGKGMDGQRLLPLADRGIRPGNRRPVEPRRREHPCRQVLARPRHPERIAHPANGPTEPDRPARLPE